jgi:hypothetical protein
MNRTAHSGAYVALFVGTVLVGCGGARGGSAFVPGPVADFRNASTAEIRNAQDQVLLSGRFVETSTDSSEVERKATLAATSAGATASGAVEVEACRGSGCDKQEIELDIVNVPPATVLRLIIDGKDVGSVTSDARGRASVEREIPLPR